METYLMPFVLRFRKLPCLLTQPEPLLKATAGKRLVQSAKRILVQPVLMAFRPREARLPLHSGFMTLTLPSPTLCDSSGVARHDESNKVWKKKKTQKSVQNASLSDLPWTKHFWLVGQEGGQTHPTLGQRGILSFGVSTRSISLTP